MDFYEPEEFFKFISVVDDLRYKCFFELLYYCGLRRSEARGLQWKHIDFNNKTLTVKAGIRRIRLHDFRHSCASALISGAAPITAVSNFLGHSETTETLETYTHMFKKDLANVPKFFDTLEKNFNEKSSK